MKILRHQDRDDETRKTMTRIPTSDTNLIALTRALLHRRTPMDRIPRLLYLIDWKSAIENGAQATGIEWTVDARGNPDFDGIDHAIDGVIAGMRGGPSIVRTMLEIARDPEADLPDTLQDAYRHTIEATRDLDRVRLEVLVKSTHPCLTAREEEVLDMADHASRYALLGDAATA